MKIQQNMEVRTKRETEDVIKRTEPLYDEALTTYGSESEEKTYEYDDDDDKDETISRSDGEESQNSVREIDSPVLFVVRR